MSRTGNLDLLRSLGADEVIDYTQEDFTAGEQRYDVVFDVGANRTPAECCRALAPNGKLVFVGAPPELVRALWRLLSTQGRSRGAAQRISFMARIRRDSLLVLKELAEAGKLRPVIDRRFPLSEVPDAMRLVGTRQSRGKVAIIVA